jgi:DNA-3-methyladenine glycosylase
MSVTIGTVNFNARSFNGHEQIQKAAKDWPDSKTFGAPKNETQAWSPEMIELTPLPQSFYKPSARLVASRLLGHWLIRNTRNGPCGGAIVETEAYLCDDPACHGAPGPTDRNRVMFGPPGHGYVYLIYGYHFCVNAVCQPRGVAEAVLVRAIEPLFGEELMRRQRPVAKPRDLTNGPAKLCEAMDIDRRLDGIDLCDPASALFIARNPSVKQFRKDRGPIVTTRRIGITRAAELPLRFYLNASNFISRRITFAPAD